MARRREYEPCVGAYDAEEIAEFNRIYDIESKRKPSHIVGIPPGFDKRLDDDELNALVWPYLRALEQPIL